MAEGVSEAAPASGPDAAAAAAAAGSGSGSGRLVIVGSGIAGLSAALEASRAVSGLEVVVLEKNAAVGGNSARASSGINAVNPTAGDSVELFAADTLRSGGGLSKPELVERLAASSADAMAFLSDLGAALPATVRLGGHSVPRTRTNVDGPNVGFVLVRALEAAVRAQPSVRIVTGAKVGGVAYSGDGRLVVTYSEQGQQQQAGKQAGAGGSVTLVADGLVFASGGFAASRELLSRYCPDAAGLPTTNGPWATGDAVPLAEALGAGLVDMERVQVHPTGFVDPRDPGSSSKFLAPEKLRGCGGVLLDASGRRFVDELATRDVVAAAIARQPGAVAWLLLGPEGAHQFGEAALSFYAAKGLVTKVAGASEAAAHMGVDAAALAAALGEYDATASTAEAAGSASPPPGGFDATGKRFFPSRVQGAGGGPLFLARVTPVTHYTMGGLAITPDAAVIGRDGAILPRLWAAGEAAGGLHGANRLGGNSLLETAVFGRAAGASAARAISRPGPQQAPAAAATHPAHASVL
ncbi:hypothetical protein Rsub_12346 [Raphidocelis subcapitata]|uniref:FAD-dependent oxidoreductase 2 FAD-binding domain-containing protein n=1 Tax=Raphidocelis subcapitata TaxID=307507 RepID=A0A2V0PNM3_9CHLO|nr:hypothetical protein Rsub_12346 [Raphidocelis subcapitata]|eukprot:GBF99540.1 hypothetical protein Rsub_12346 [Raphidocelis subcapitata]